MAAVAAVATALRSLHVRTRLRPRELCSLPPSLFSSCSAVLIRTLRTRSLAPLRSNSPFLRSRHTRRLIKSATKSPTYHRVREWALN